jgi:hypothetical protein
MKITLFLPDSTHETLAGFAKSEGVELSQYCSNVLTDFSAGERRIEYVRHSTNGGANNSPQNPKGSKPNKVIPQKQLIEDIILFLRKSGGAAEKAVVEKAVFEKNKTEFSKPYWNELVGLNVPRWKKNTQFARNTAREMELIKAPEDSGHGLWELTEIGSKWKFE